MNTPLKVFKEEVIKGNIKWGEGWGRHVLEFEVTFEIRHASLQVGTLGHLPECIAHLHISRPQKSVSLEKRDALKGGFYGVPH